MWVFLPVLSLLCLTVHLSTSTTTTTSINCSWEDLQDLEFRANQLPQTFQVKAKDEMTGDAGSLKLMFDFGDDEETHFTESIEPPDFCNVTMSCSDTVCGYDIMKSNKNNTQRLLSIGLKRVIIKGDTVEWRRHCNETEERITTATTTTTTEKATPTTTTSTTTRDMETTPGTTTTTTTEPTTRTTPAPTTSTHYITTTETNPTTIKSKPIAAGSKKSKATVTGAIVGIAIFVLVLALLGVCFFFRHRFHSAVLNIQGRARTMTNPNHEVVTEQETAV